MIITVVTSIKDEHIMLPFFLRHYGRFADNIVVYDGYSTDGTRDILNASSAQMIDSYTGGIRDDIHLDIKNNARTHGGDWFITVDCDEFIYYDGDMRVLLDNYTKDGITLPKMQGYDMCGDHIPEDGLLTDIFKMGIVNNSYSKRVVFHKSVEPCFLPGCHTALHKGAVIESANIDLKLLHYWCLSREYVAYKRSQIVLSPINLAYGWGTAAGTGAQQPVENYVAGYDYTWQHKEQVI